MQQAVIGNGSTNATFDTFSSEDYPKEKVYSVKVVREKSSSDTYSMPLLDRFPVSMNDYIKYNYSSKKEIVYNYTVEASIFKHIENLIYKNISFPDKWQEEEVAEPNIAAKTRAMDACFHLYKKYDLIPVKILANKDEGITIFYKHYNSNRSLLVETSLIFIQIINTHLYVKLRSKIRFKIMGYGYSSKLPLF